MLSVNTNLSSITALRNLNATNAAMDKNLEKLSSGLRINRAGDDAAGLAISEKMRGQVKGLNQATRNAQDGISMIQTAEGALNETHAILQRMRELSVQSANDSYTGTDRTKLDKEFGELKNEIDRISNNTEFNTQPLLDGSFTGKLIHIGANAGQTLTIGVNQMDSASLTLGAIDVTSQTNADAAITAVDGAIDAVSTERATLGAWQNRLEHTVNNLSTASENLTAAESRIRDVDMAKEMSEFTKNQILAQAGTSMLAQSNQRAQGILSLFR